MRLKDCHNFHDFRQLAMQRLPGPIFDYIDGAADDEVTLRRNTASFERCDLVPNVLRGVETVDLSTTVMGQKLAVPFIVRRLRFSVYSTIRANKRSQPPHQNAGRCSAYPR
jgi:isopentenyl diphosphate isomerase/L-lactate dehydrogenase-like FMN-dependent dehydrogenase